MNKALQSLITLAVLLAIWAAVSAGAVQSPAPDSELWGAQQWTTYDWNANSGNSQPARFEVVKGETGPLLQVIAGAPNDARFVREREVQPDSVYHFSCQVRSENIGATARGAGISVTDIQGGSPDINTGNGDWNLLEFYGKTGSDQHKITVTVGIGGYGSLNSGSAWFKDVAVERVDRAPGGARIVPLQPPATDVSPPAARNSAGGVVVICCCCLGLLMAGWGMALRRRLGMSSATAQEQPVSADAVQAAVEWADLGIMVVLTVISLAVSLWNLGGHTAPETGWQPVSSKESATIELGRNVKLSRIYYYSGINERSGDGSQFSLAARNSVGDFVTLADFTKDDTETWKFCEVDVQTTAVRITADSPGGRLNEIAFVERGSQTPLAGLTITEKNASDKDRGKPENLIDEQAAFEYAPSFRTGFYFDEIYHARSAWEMLNQIEPYETTHPPLGKLLIAAGISFFGMNAFGWRVVGALFGVALVPMMYLFGLKLFRNRFYAFCAGFLMMVEFMRFAQSRVALIDVYGVFFILVMYYIILDLFPEKGQRPCRSAYQTMLLAGVAFGVGAACKWIALYAGCGLSLLVVLRTAADLKQRAYPEEMGVTGFLLRRMGISLVAFGVIPVLIYLLAYVPFLSLPGPGHGIGDVVSLQAHMLNYHRKLQATHPFASPWWSWPLDMRPMWIYTGAGLPEGKASSIVTFGNPAVFWLGIPAVAAAAVTVVRRRDVRMGLVLIALVFQYLPWLGINRLAFIYHFFSTVPFIILCLVAAIRGIEAHSPGFRGVTWGYLGVAAGFFALFYPVLSGLLVSQDYIAWLRWFPSWIF